MKKRKRSLLQRMMAVLLSAVLVTGMVSNAVPMTVLAQESGETPEGVSGNSVDTVGVDIEPTEETDSDKQEDTEITEGADGETGQKGQKPDGGAKQETDSENTAAPEAVAQTAEESAPVMAAAPAVQAGDTRDVTFTFKIYGYNSDKFPLELNNVVVIWSKNAEEFIEGEENKKAVTEDGYTCWSYTFRNLDVNKRYEVKEKNAPGHMYAIEPGSGTEYEKIGYAVNFYDGNELSGVQYVTSGNCAGKTLRRF